MLVAAFALLVVASGVGLWRAVARNQSAMRYLQSAEVEDTKVLSKAELGPEKWAVVGPIQTLLLVVRAEIGALRFGNSTALAASMTVNTEIAHWLAQRERVSVAAFDADVLDALAREIRSLWEEGRWGSGGSLDAPALLSRLQLLERSLRNAASQVAAGHSPYR